MLLQQARVNKTIGIVFYFQGQYEQSLLSYQAALDYFQQQPFSAEIAIKQANLLNNIALVQTSQGDAVAALKSYQQAEPLYQRYGDEVDKIDVRYNLAVLYISLRRFDIAISMLKDVIAKREVIGDDYGVAQASGDLGVSYKHSGQYQQAEQYLSKAIAIRNKYERELEEIRSSLELVKVYFATNQDEKAYSILMQAIDKIIVFLH